jgi:NAD(P)-dependent dehydrogenase (short-subunit alcohol dehydrogenase family)
MIEGKHIMVTGATSGIGFAVTQDLLARGAKVTAVGRNADRLDELKRLGGDALQAVSFDLTDFDRYREFVSSNASIDGLVCSAGIVENNPLRYFSMEKYQRTVAINQTAPLALVSELIRSGKISSGASIVFISSILGTKVGIKGTAAYAGTKAALLAFTKVMALELSNKSIRVNCVSPGMVETELLDGLSELSESAVRADKDRYPLGKRYARPAEIAASVRFLLSNESSFITGQNVVIDGGYSIQ